MRKLAVAVVCVSMLAYCGSPAGKDSPPMDRLPQYFSLMAKRLRIKPQQLEPPEVTLFIENVSVSSLLGVLEEQDIKPVGKVEGMKEKIVAQVGTGEDELRIRGRTAENEVAPAGDRARGAWRVCAYEMSSSQEATMVTVYLGDGMSCAIPQVGAQWEGKDIGELSIGHFHGGREENIHWGTTVFRRGNIAIAILGGRSYVGQPVVDARKPAALVDPYLLRRPDEGLTPTAKWALKAFDILIHDITATAPHGPARHVLAGTSYGLSLKGLPDGAKGNELRLYTEHGTVVRDAGGALRVTFKKEGKHKIYGYSVDAKGKCVAAAIEEVLVSAEKAQGPPAIPSIDVAKPKTWSKGVAEAQKILDDMSDALISVARDEKQISRDRTSAIWLLGRIGNRRALHFLAANVSMHIQPPILFDSVSQWPCRKALAEFGSPAGKAILKAIAATESEDDLKHLAYALARVYGRPKAAVIVLGEQDWVPTEKGRKNMDAVKKLLEKPEQ